MSCKDCNNTDPCKSKDCSCPVQGMTANCVEYNGEKMSCSGIEPGMTMDEVVYKLDELLCSFKYDNVSSIKNVGKGSEVFKGLDNLGVNELRSLTSLDGTVEIVQGTNTIDFSVKEFKLNNEGEGIKVLNPNTKDTLRTLISSNSSIGIKLNGNEIDFTFPGISLKNEGLGAKVLDENNKYTFRTITSSDLSIKVTQKSDTIDITSNVDIPEYTAGNNIMISGTGEISARDTTYTFLDGLTKNNNNEVSLDNTVARVNDLYTDEKAQDAVGNILSTEFTYDDVNNKIEINKISSGKITGLHSVATSGDYNELINKLKDGKGTEISNTNNINTVWTKSTW